jgi:hypothetical protein
MTRSLKDEVLAAFADAISDGHLAIAAEARHATWFGNEFVTLRGAGFLLRLTRDRGDSDAVLAFSPEGEWYPLDWVVAALRVQDAGQGYPGPPQSITPIEASLLARAIGSAFGESPQGREARSKVEAAISEFDTRRLGELEVEGRSRAT